MAENYKNPHNNPKLNVDKIRTTLTAVSIFMMGIIDAYAVIMYGTLVSAQTGNLVTIAREIAANDWSGLWIHAIVFFAFAIGAFCGKAAQEILRKSWRRFRMYLLFQTILLLILAMFQESFSATTIIFWLAWLSGYDLALFRNFNDTRANNGVMTGNTKTMMSNLFVGLYHKDKQALRDAFNLFLVLLIFLSGVIVGSGLVLWDPLIPLWASFGLMFGAMGWLAYLNIR